MLSLLPDPYPRSWAFWLDKGLGAGIAVRSLPQIYRNFTAIFVYDDRRYFNQGNGTTCQLIFGTTH